MGESNTENKLPPKEHIASVFKEYTTPSRVLRSFANLSNTVIQTALSGQSKFVFEILQNADDAYENEDKEIEVRFALQDNFLIVHHNGKGFDYNDVERICDYASQIEEVKATDLRKTGYKGLGFKSLFNLSDSIYICSNGYSFRFDKTHWSDPENRPWQVIPIWCEDEELPLRHKYTYDHPVNFILKVNNSKQLESELREIIDRPDLLLYLYRIHKLGVEINGIKHFLERRQEKFGEFNKIVFLGNQKVTSTWLSKTYNRSVEKGVQKSVGEGSRFIYPDKIKRAKEVSVTFTLQCDEDLKKVSKIEGLCYSTLPTQIHLNLPYHINSLFILNLDRTQLHENEWNEFLLYQIGILQFYLLRDLAEVTHLKNYVVDLFVRGVNHPFKAFSNAFLKGFRETRGAIGWLPPYHGSRLLKLGETWTDEIQFFKQNFQNIRDDSKYPYLIDYDVKKQSSLRSEENEANHFTFDTLLKSFPNFYSYMLNKNGFINFITYLYEKSKDDYNRISKLQNNYCLRAKNGDLLIPSRALLEENDSPIPDFLQLNPVDNEYLPSNYLIKEWLVRLGAKRLNSVILILRESVLKWVSSRDFVSKTTSKDHMKIINYIAKGASQLTYGEMENLQAKLHIRTESGQFKRANECYLSCAVPIVELEDIISNDDKISSSYDLNYLKKFFVSLGVNHVLSPIEVLRRSVLKWIGNGEIVRRITMSNYLPIIEYVAKTFLSVKGNLKANEISDFKKMLVLTRDQVFQKAQDCFFDTAIPKTEGLECVIANNEVVANEFVSESVEEFLIKIGVKKDLDPIEVIRRSILKWIRQNEITIKITLNNHQNILQYIANHWTESYYLTQEERSLLRTIPILTKSDTFREASKCYFLSNPDSRPYEEIPMVESIITSDEFISPKYYHSMQQTIASSNRPIPALLKELGVRTLSFVDICERYCDYLTHPKNVKWFFSNLEKQWSAYLKDKWQNLQQKLKTSRLLAKNGRTYYPTELYSSQFNDIHDIDLNSLPLLEYENLPRDLEAWLGFKMDLDFDCIKQLLNAVDKAPKLGQEKTLKFFSTLLEQLKRKNKNEIQKHQLRLLSQDNKLKLAKELYYFTEEDKTCVLDSCYLKRILNMSHEKTLQLAELCGVNILRFSEEVQTESETCHDTLKTFYLERLPFIVTHESKNINEEPSVTLKRLYDTVCALELFECQHIFVKYPFGDRVEIPNHFQELKIYVDRKWTKLRTLIHKYLRNKLCLTFDAKKFDYIMDMETVISTDREDWLKDQTDEDKKIFYSIEALNLVNGGKLPSLQKAKVDRTPGSHEELSSKFLEDGKFTADECVSVETSRNSIDDVSLAREADEDSRIYTKIDEELNVVSNNDEFITSSVVEDSVMVDRFSKEVENNRKVCLDEEKLLSKESVKFDPLTAEDEEKFAIDVMRNEKIFPGESSSCDISKEFVSGEYISQTRNEVQEKCIGVFGTFRSKPRYKSHNRSLKSQKDCMDVGTKHLVPRAVEFESNKLVSSRISHIIHSSQSFHPLPSPGACSEVCQTKRLSEEYVFNYVHDCFKIKYPNSQFDLANAEFNISIKLPVDVSIPHTQHAVQEKCIGVFGTLRNEPKFNSSNELMKTEYVMEVDAKSLVPAAVEIKNNRLVRVTTPDVNYSTNNSPPLSSPEISCEEYQMKREECMFNCLQDFYRIRYPNSQFDLANAVFNISIKLPADDSISQSRHEVQDWRFGTFRNESKFISYKRTVKRKDCLEVGAKRLVSRAIEFQSNDPITGRTFDVIQSTENSPPQSSPEDSSEECQIKRLSEEYVFNYLQDYYKIKYPNFQFDLANGVFKISDNRQGSLKVKVVWLNVNGEKGQPYDLTLEKEGDVKRVIEVQSDVTLGDSFNVQRVKFIKITNQFESEFPDHEEKYCIYHVSYEINSLKASIVGLKNPTLYKVVPIKN